MLHLLEHTHTSQSSTHVLNRLTHLCFTLFPSRGTPLVHPSETPMFYVEAHMCSTFKAPMCFTFSLFSSTPMLHLPKHTSTSRSSTHVPRLFGAHMCFPFFRGSLRGSTHVLGGEAHLRFSEKHTCSPPASLRISWSAPVMHHGSTLRERHMALMRIPRAPLK